MNRRNVSTGLRILTQADIYIFHLFSLKCLLFGTIYFPQIKQKNFRDFQRS